MKKQALTALPSLSWGLPTSPRSRTLLQLSPGHLSWLLYRSSSAWPPFAPIEPPGPGSALGRGLLDGGLPSAPCLSLLLGHPSVALLGYI